MSAYKQAIDLVGQPAKAWRIIGASSCFEHDADGAATAWRSIDDHGKKLVEYVCKRNQVTLPDGAPVL